MPSRLESLLTACLSAAVPFRCPVCGKPPFDGSPGMFCAECLESLPFIAPPYCPGCGGPMDGILDVCPKCLHQPPRPWSRAFSLFHMEGNARQAVMMLKYRNRPEFARALGRLLGDKLKRELPCSVDMVVVHPARVQSGRPDLPGHLRGTRRPGGPGAPPVQTHPAAGAPEPQGKNFEFKGCFFADGLDKMRKACYISCGRCFDDGYHACFGGVRSA